MPKVVDHDERRHRIAQATWRVISRDGVRGATVRAVAAEAGLSVGALRHYFDDQTSLILFATELSVETIGERIRHELVRADRGHPIDVAQSCLEQLLPLDRQRVSETAVYFGVIDQTRLRSEYRQFRQTGFRLAQRLYRQLVGWLAEHDPVTPEALTEDQSPLDDPMIDPNLEAQARSLQMLVDGLAVNGLMLPTQVDGDTMRTMLRWELQRIRPS